MAGRDRAPSSVSRTTRPDRPARRRGSWCRRLLKLRPANRSAHRASRRPVRRVSFRPTPAHSAGVALQVKQPCRQICAVLRTRRYCARLGNSQPKSTKAGLASPTVARSSTEISRCWGLPGIRYGVEVNRRVHRIQEPLLQHIRQGGRDSPDQKVRRDPGQVVRSCWTANTTASVRLGTPSLLRILRM